MKAVTWSHSALKDFEGCPRRYHEVKVLNKYPFQETEATHYGKEFHTAAELYIRDGTPLPKQFSYAQEVLDALEHFSGDDGGVDDGREARAREHDVRRRPRLRHR